MAIEARLQRLRERLAAPVDVASLAAFRVVFGLMMFVGVVRFAAKGWITDQYVTPETFFTFDGFGWVRPWPGWGMYAHFAGLGVLALCIAVGLFYRWAIVLFFVGFTYVELIDRTNYLNHYYLISLLALLMSSMPLEAMWSLDAWRDAKRRRTTVPRWCLVALRAQVGLVYFFAGVAKLRADWLFDAQPLTIWLAAKSDIPLVGALFTLPGAPHVASWLAAAFDLSLPFLLSWRRARPYAYAVAVVFHAATGVLFELGMFPWIMTASALVFFPPSWPRSRVGAKPFAPSGVASGLSRWGAVALAAYFVVQVAVPVRKHLYPGDVAWTERGFDFSWHVMLQEKAGVAWFHVSDPATGAAWQVHPERYLTPRQHKMMTTSPAMIAQLAHHVARDFARRGHPDVAVRAEVYVTLNGRPSAMLIDPDVDLAHEALRLASDHAPRDGTEPSAMVRRSDGARRGSRRPRRSEALRGRDEPE